MDTPLQPQRLAWQEAVVVATVVETPTVKTFTLRPATWSGFAAGQHVDVRLTAPDGYQAQRSYSIGSAPGDHGTFDLTVEVLENGEVSPFFHEVVEVGDTIEIRGPIGGHFVWRPGDGGPLLLMAGGSGLVPLMSILRHRANVAPHIPAALIVSARDLNHLIWCDELFRRAEREVDFHLFVTLTRSDDSDERVGHGRIDAGLVKRALASLPSPPMHTFICGSTPFVGTASTLALDAMIPFETIKTERYGG